MQENQTIVIGTLQEVMPKEELAKITKQTIIIETKSKWPKKIALDKEDNVYVLDPALSGYKIFDKNLD